MLNNLTKEKVACYVHDKLDNKQREEIRTYACLGREFYPFTLHNDGNTYCLFHLPSVEKNAEEFEKFFRQKLLDTERWIENINALPNKERQDAESKIGYDFHCLWFPSRIELSGYKFRAIAIFNSAYFSKGANFSDVTFSKGAYFYEAVFKQSANFRDSIFEELSHFTGTNFEGYANFGLAVFVEDVLFELATFAEEADFRSVTFRKGAYFHRIKTTETSKISFIWTAFQQLARFDEAIIKGYLHFEAGEGDIFDGKWISPIIGDKRPEIEKRFTPVFEGSLELHHIGAEKPERITFNKVRLRPNWFVNADSRKFVLTDTAWENNRGKDSELKQELKELTERLHKEPHNYQILTIAFRNLAANAEEFNRFEDASNFRKSASECERLERLYKQRMWWRNSGKYWGKHILCRDFFSEAKKCLIVSWKLIKTVKFDFVHFLYRWLSGYGERWFRAFCWLWVIWIVFALGYHFLGVFGSLEKREHLEFGKSFGYSLLVMTLQRPEPRPYDWITYLLYGLETILAPVQAALLALAIRRKFMR